MAVCIKTTALRYCQVIGHNVFMEVSEFVGQRPGEVATGQCSVDCLNYHQCLQSLGGCRNDLVKEKVSAGSDEDGRKNA